MLGDDGGTLKETAFSIKQIGPDPLFGCLLY